MAKSIRSVYELEIGLRDVSPRIYRRFCVRSDSHLPAFHVIIQIVMGWQNCHLHEFQAGNSRYGVPDEDFPDMSIKDEQKVRISRLLKKPGDSIKYVYDYGDDWFHDIELVSISDWIPDISITPVCLDGKRACPPEDVGGPPGFAGFLEAISNPSYEDRTRFKEWIGGDYDPGVFDINVANVLLGHYVGVDA